MTFGGLQSVDLTWNPVPGAESYNIYRTTVSGAFANSLIGSTTGTFFQDLGNAAASGTAPPTDSFAPLKLLKAAIADGGTLEPLTTYFYAVSSIGPNGESTINAYQSVTTSTGALGGLKVNLTWTAENDVTGYRIYRSTRPITQANLSNDLIAILTSGAAASYADSGATFQVQGTTTAASAVITNVASTSQLTAGMSVTGANLTGGPYYILSVNSATQITLNTGTGITAGTGASPSTAQPSIRRRHKRNSA